MALPHSDCGLTAVVSLLSGQCLPCVHGSVVTCPSTSSRDHALAVVLAHLQLFIPYLNFCFFLVRTCAPLPREG